MADSRSSDLDGVFYTNEERRGTKVSGQFSPDPLSPSFVPPELSVSDEIFHLFSDLINTTSGIKLDERKKGLLASRLAKRLKKFGMQCFSEYYKKVKSDNQELVEMLNCISTNTTKFFREQYHFEYLKNKVIPDVAGTKSLEKAIRIWSAGCSTGEEPYSIAIAVSEAMSGISGWNIKVLATDISTKALETGQTGIYEYEELPDDTPLPLLGGYFLRGTGEHAGMIKVKDFVRDMIRFRRLNLKDETYPFSREFDVIFCRNVMIYFDEHMKRHVLSMFHRHLSDNGYLFLGHSETMLGNGKFKPAYITVYKKQ
ncbi:MAG: protein-glutamate O-methyltransferase CheR [Nitrospirae bacterium]|nr:protein-glutamate O-methyltransferase CheR [Nitrospirota bacterium]MCL5977790.1 protein-glutamate O-methyltransferase CheR [Nitrospirota bacterium]